MAQEQKSVQPLEEVISSIEKEIPYTFTYADKIIEGIKIVPPSSGLSLDQTLNYLRKETHLMFTVVSGNFISINRSNETLTLCGTIKDSYGNPVNRATLIATSNSTITNQEGNFELTVQNRSEQITVSHVSFESAHLLPSQFIEGECLEVFLKPKLLDLQQITLTNYITKGIDKSTEGNFSINFSDFGSIPGLIETDVLQTIQELPGIQSSDETVSNINIRGGTHDQNLILWDGIKMYQSGHFFGLISIFNPNLTSKAVLIKNGTNAEFGDAVSGTINISSDENVQEDFSLGIGLNLINADVYSDIPIGKKSSIQVSARKAISEFWESFAYTKYFERIAQDNELDNEGRVIENSNLEFDFYDTNLTYKYQISDKDKLRLNFFLVNNNLVFEENDIVNSEFSSRQSSISQSNLAAGIWYQREWNPKFMTALQLYETDYTLKATDAILSDSRRSQQENSVSESSAKLNSRYQVNKTIAWNNGYQFTETGITNLVSVDNPVFVNQTVRVIRTHSVFSQLDYLSKNKKRLLNLGLRYTYNDKFGSSIFEPRLTFNQKIGNYFNFEILGEFKHQYSSQQINLQNEFLGVEKRRWVLADGAEIPVIEGKQISTGIQYHRKGWLVSGEGYIKQVDSITAKSQGFRNKYQGSVATGSYQVYGLDLLINKRLKNISTWLSYTYAKNEYIFNALEDFQFPNNIDITHSFSAGASYEKNKLKCSLGAKWHSGLPTTRPQNDTPASEDNTILYQDANSDTLRPYFRLDASIVYEFGLSHKTTAHTGFSVWNITNNDNVISNYYTLNENDNIPMERTVNALRLTPNLVFRVSF